MRLGDDDDDVETHRRDIFYGGLNNFSQQFQHTLVSTVHHLPRSSRQSGHIKCNFRKIEHFNMDQVQLHRLDSYQASQSGGIAGNSSEAEDDVMERQERNNNNVVGQVQTQLSFAQGNDTYYDEIMDDAGNNNRISFSVLKGPRKYFRFFLRVLRERKITILPILVLIILVMLSLHLLHRDGKSNSIVENKSDANTKRDFSSSPSNLTCPIQSSYYVSSEVMGLKKISTGKSTTTTPSCGPQLKCFIASINSHCFHGAMRMH